MEAVIVRILQDCPQKQRQEVSGMKGNFTRSSTHSEHMQTPSLLQLLPLGTANIRPAQRVCANWVTGDVSTPWPARDHVPKGDRATVLSLLREHDVASCRLHIVPTHVSQPFPVILHLPCSCNFPFLPRPPALLAPIFLLPMAPFCFFSVLPLKPQVTLRALLVLSSV